MEPAETQESVPETDVSFMFPVRYWLSFQKRIISKSSSTCGNYSCFSKPFYFLLLPETHPYYVHAGRKSS